MSTRRAEGAVGPPGPRLHYAEFEAYRGVAALAVVVFHAYQFVRVDGAYVYAGTPADALLHQLDGAVAVFLVLSGFLLWEPVARALVTGAPPGSARSFLTRRAIRVVPLYVIATMVVWAWRTPGWAEGWPELATHLTFTHVFVADHVFSVIGPAWSLAVEVHAYVLLAVLIAVLARTGRAGAPRPTAAWALPVVVVVASVAWKAWAFGVASVPLDDFTVWYSTLARLDNVGLGMLLGALVAVRPSGLRSPALWALRLGALAVVVASTVLRVPGTWGEVYVHTLVAVAAALLLAGSAWAPRDGAWVRTLSWRPLALVGLWSYSVYLWHEPVMQGLGEAGWLPASFPVLAPVMVAIAVAVGFVSYWVLEYPSMQLRHLHDDRRHVAAPPRPSRLRREVEEVRS